MRRLVYITLLVIFGLVGCAQAAPVPTNIAVPTDAMQSITIGGNDVQVIGGSNNDGTWNITKLINNSDKAVITVTGNIITLQLAGKAPATAQVNAGEPTIYVGNYKLPGGAWWYHNKRITIVPENVNPSWTH